MTPESLALTHAAAFGGTGWPAQDFQQYLADKTVLIFGDAECFAVMRVLGPEAEILTLATHPDKQGTGRATALLDGALAKLGTANVTEVFLDVADDNAAALALYRRCGFTQFATRNNYYASGASAICMKALLSPASPR